MRFQEAHQQLKSGRGKKFLLSGPEDFLKEHLIQCARGLSPDFFVFYSDEAVNALETVSTVDLFSSARSLILYDIDKMKPERFVEPIRESEDVVIATLSEKADLKSRAVTELIGVMAPVACEKLRNYGNDYPLWITGFISESGFNADDGVSDLIFDRVGDDMFALSKEIRKLLLVTSESKRITIADVSKYVSITAKTSAFDILDDLLKKDVKAALRRFDSFSESSESLVEFVKFLCNYMEKLYRILLLRDKKFESDDIADIVGIPRFLVKTKYLPKALGLGKSTISAKIDQLCSLDVRVRTFKGDKRILIEQFIYSFA